MKLYATTEIVEGHEYVHVIPGDASDKLWRSRGYVEAAELSGEEDFDLESMTIPELRDFAEAHGLDVDLSGNKAEKIAAIRAALE